MVKQKSSEIYYYAEETSSDNQSGRGESVNKTATKVAWARHKNTNYGKGIFCHEKLDFKTMI